jgi:hypothetical protein
MSPTAGHRVVFRVDADVDELDELLGVTTACRHGSQPCMWSATARDGAELHGMLERLHAAGLALVSIDAISPE